MKYIFALIILAIFSFSTWNAGLAIDKVYNASVKEKHCYIGIIVEKDAVDHTFKSNVTWRYYFLINFKDAGRLLELETSHENYMIFNKGSEVVYWFYPERFSDPYYTPSRDIIAGVFVFIMLASINCACIILLLKLFKKEKV